MATIIVEQFNPVHGYWNKLYEVASADFDPEAPITVNKYDGPYRTRTIDEVEPEIVTVPEMMGHGVFTVEEKPTKEPPFFSESDDDGDDEFD